MDKASNDAEGVKFYNRDEKKGVWMRYSQMLLPTRKETPAEAEVISHRLMFRAGLIRKVAAGIYTYLPLGLRTIRKVEAIVREEMNAAGAQEVLMPMVQPADLWVESGRWEFYGKELLRLKDRNNRDYCLGPTHEEVITDLVRREIRSYRDLPLNLYQIQGKFRDEVRPRFGVMRAREFIMKDAYSFDRDDASAEVSYQAMYKAYTRIFERCGLRFKAVEADSGSIGGSHSHEFMVLAETGEDVILSCNRCTYAANTEKAVSLLPETGEPHKGGAVVPTMEKVYTPGKKRVRDVADFLKVEEKRLIKTLLFETDQGFVAGLIRGDLELNPIKLKNLLGVNFIVMASDEEVKRLTKADVGFAGPIGLPIPVIADPSVMSLHDAVCGANETDYHLIHVKPERDFEVSQVADIRQARAGEICSRCGKGTLESFRGIEVGHVFKLGTKYSEAMGATFLDETGKERFIIMGCYGIGIERTVAAAIEQSHDEDGIVFHESIAPFSIEIVPVQMKDERVVGFSNKLYGALTQKGLEVLLDDREVRPGVKFKDADLIGIPLRAVVGRKFKEEGLVEIKSRETGKVEEVLADEVVEILESKVSHD